MPNALRSLARSSFVCALVLALLASPREIEAQRTVAAAISIRDVHVAGNPALAEPLRVAVEETLASIDVAHGSRPTFVLDVAVTRLASVAMDRGSRVDCEVSIVVEDARRHAIRSVLTGRARVIGDQGEALTHAAVRAAARGALRSLPTAISAR